MNEVELMDSAELVEKYVILLLGVKEQPIKSDLYLQKEMFLLSNFKESLKEDFVFEKHYFGPYSRVVEEVIINPPYVKNAFDFEDKRISLSKNGKGEYSRLIEENKTHPEFNYILLTLKLIRDIYDELSSEELLYLIYKTFPEYIGISEGYDRFKKNLGLRKRIIESLYSKGVISEERYIELKNERE